MDRASAGYLTCPMVLIADDPASARDLPALHPRLNLANWDGPRLRAGNGRRLGRGRTEESMLDDAVKVMEEGGF